MPKAFTAWRRLPGDTWQRFAEADTQASAWRAALTAGAAAGGSGETVVLPAGRHPDDGPTRATYPRAREA